MPLPRYSVISINMSPGERDQVHALARKRGFRITSDYLRHLIEEDAKAHGDEMKFTVDRGGYRGGDKQEGED